MNAVRVQAECAQCGREAPPDSVELRRWRHGDLALDEHLDDVAAAMILCPDCDAEDRGGQFDSGEPG
jgi:hypothetical protein